MPLCRCAWRAMCLGKGQVFFEFSTLAAEQLGSSFHCESTHPNQQQVACIYSCMPSLWRHATL